MKNIIKGEFVKHPSNDGVFMKHFFSKADNDRLNNLEVIIVPGFQIAPHVHDDSTEFYYCVSGEGEFLDDKEWIKIKSGDAFKAQKGVTHALKNTGCEPLKIFSTFSPAIR
ncbi:MAG: cupin domain-containing protein [Fusobacteriaceae bacterium]